MMKEGLPEMQKPECIEALHKLKNDCQLTESDVCVLVKFCPDAVELMSTEFSVGFSAPSAVLMMLEPAID